jgi:adenylyltransferase/sulfurtransferase
LFGVNEVGMEKVKAAKQRLQGLNPYININIHHRQLTSKNALELIQQYDVVADGTDNFPTRYLVNDACVLLGKTNVYASIFQFDGQVTVFNHRNKEGDRGPNYRDLFAAPPPPGLVPNCAEGGVLGVLPGIMGSMQALEVIKVITGVGEILNGRLFLFDALTFESRILNIKKSPTNPLTGENPTLTELIDYEQFCNMKAVERKTKEITVWDLYDWQERGEDFQLIDVREEWEYSEASMSGLLLPLATVLSQASKISRDKKVVIHCKMGGRSAKAIRELEDNLGFSNLYNLKGGITAYLNEVQPVHGSFEGHAA